MPSSPVVCPSLAWMSLFLFPKLLKHPTAKMSSTGVEPTKQYDVDIQQLKEKDTLHSEILVNKDLMTDAFQGEDSEHNQSLWQAVVSHKMACFWAFVMCFTMSVFLCS